MSGQCQSAWGAHSVSLLACKWHYPAGHSLYSNLRYSYGPGGGCLPCTMEQSSSEPSSSWPGVPQPSWPPTRAACRLSPSAVWCWGWSCSSWGCSGLWTAKVLQTTTTGSLIRSVHIIHTTTIPTSAAVPSLHHQGVASQSPSQYFSPGKWRKNLFKMRFITFFCIFPYVFVSVTRLIQKPGNKTRASVCCYMNFIYQQ